MRIEIPQDGVVIRWREYLGLPPQAKAIGLGEGNTPLIHLEQFCQKHELDLELYVKFEGLNPTGSFKDRGMAVAVTEALHNGAKTLLCASTGNTSAAAAAYAARAGLACVVLIPEGKIASGKLAQAIMYGATIIQIKGNFDQGMQLVKEISSERDDIALVNSVNPMRLEGQKTASFEITTSLGRAPEYHVLPVGNAGNISAYWKGYVQAKQIGLSDSLPRMVGYQASGAAPFIHGAIVESPETIATAIRIGNPQSWQLAKDAVSQSNGWFGSQTDQELIAALKYLSESEGIFCEPASAISIAGVIESYKRGVIKKGATVVCTLTGNGLKDTAIIDQYDYKNRIAVVEPEYHQIVSRF
ncbi:MAG: threonine synthase [Methylacidiphilales bacterium]|nr:threonine synthase [Candidatus Methylacidiphilales bacterium]